MSPQQWFVRDIPRQPGGLEPALGDMVSALRLCHRLALLRANIYGAALGREYMVQPLGKGPLTEGLSPHLWNGGCCEKTGRGRG